MMSKQEILATNPAEVLAAQSDEFLQDLLTTNGGFVVSEHAWGADPARAYVPSATVHELQTGQTPMTVSFTGSVALKY